ncbi:MAG: hypothetical protein AAGF30_00310 [Pseudomonadota bacterium]
MSRNVRLTGFATGETVTLEVAKPGASDGPRTISWRTPTAVTATVERYPAGDVLPGEVVTYRVTDVTGYPGDVRNLVFEWSFGDPGSTYEVAQGLLSSDANTEWGRVVSHGYKTTGNKTVTLTVTAPDSTPLEMSTRTVPVIDPDTVNWDDDLWVDFGEVSGTPDFTGAPAVGGAVQHISSMTALDAFGTDGTRLIRVTMKKGETFLWNDDQVGVRGPRTYIRSVDSFGSGARPKCVAGQVRVDGGGDPREQSMFSAGNEGDQSHIAIYGVDFDGTYDPVTGTHGTGGWACAVNGGFDSSGTFYRSFFQCAARGMRQFYGSEGTFKNNDPLKTCYLGIADVDIRDWSNYGFSQFGVRARVAVTGVSITQNPLALVRPGDGKSDSLTQAPDHGPIRISVCDYAGINNCNFGSANGWSNLGNDNALQPCIRLLITYQEDDLVHDLYDTLVANVMRCTGAGPSLLNIGANVNNDQFGFIPRCFANIEQNRFVKTRQHNGAIFTATARGVIFRNNLIILPDIYSAANVGADIFAFNNVPAYTFPAGFSTDPVVIAFNTVISHRSTASGDDSDVVLVNPKDLQGDTPIQADNIIQAATQQNPVTTYAPLDPAEDFRPATGSTAISAVTTRGPWTPLFDLRGVERTMPTSLGAHHETSASAGVVNAPVNTSPPVIAALANYPNEYHVTDLGTWSNLPDKYLYAVEWSWRLNGVPVADDYLVVHSETGTGDLTCQITVTNASGQRVSAGSNVLAV